MKNVYEIVKQNILERLQEAIECEEDFAWIKPWKGNGYPKNFKTKKMYKGINLLLLPFGGYYLTMKQVNELGGKVKKGSKSFPIFFWSYITKENDKGEIDDEQNNNEKNEKQNKDKYNSKAFFKYYRVFHQSQIEGIDFPEEETNVIYQPLKESEEFIDNYSKEVTISTIKGSNEAYYSPFYDEIVIPDRTQFKNIEEYYSTTLHEMVHSTGHKTRLDRFDKNTRFGNNAYSKEELIAEIGASMLRAYLNINSEKCNKNSIAYLKNWYNQIKAGTPNEIVIAAQKAQKAIDFIIEKVDEIKKTNNNQECA